MSRKVIVFSGPSTIGKDSVWLKAATEIGFKKLVPYTTRAIRKTEIDGVDYNFVSKEHFQNLIQEKKLLDWDFFSMNYYGTLKSDWEDFQNHDITFHCLARMAVRIKQNSFEDLILVMLKPMVLSVIEARLKDRGYLGKEYLIRLNHMYEELAHINLFDYLIEDAESTSFEDAKSKIAKIIDS